MAARISRKLAKKRAQSRAAAAAASPLATAATPDPLAQPMPRRRGRPKGSKNKPKTGERIQVFYLGEDGRPVLRGRGRPPKGAVLVDANGTPLTPAQIEAARRTPSAPRRSQLPSADGSVKRGPGRPRKYPVAPSSPIQPPAVSSLSTSGGSSPLRATVVQASSVAFLGSGTTGNVVAGSSVYVDGRSVFSDGHGLCVIPGSLIFVDSGAAPDQLGLAVTGSSSVLRVAFDREPDVILVPYKAVIANFRR